MENPAPGILLIAEPFLKDPNFTRTVILLTEHQETGSLGFVLNKPLEYSLEDLLPEAAASVQYNAAGFSPLYAEHGFYGIMKVSRWRDVYEEAVYLLAKRIVTAAEASPPVGPGGSVPYESLPSAFGGQGATGPGDKPLRVTVVAPSRDELPAGPLTRRDRRQGHPPRRQGPRPRRRPEGDGQGTLRRLHPGHPGERQVRRRTRHLHRAGRRLTAAPPRGGLRRAEAAG